jgi:hypothetical protein
MAIQSANKLLTERLAQLKQQRDGLVAEEGIQGTSVAHTAIISPSIEQSNKRILDFVVKPQASSWEDLSEKLKEVINLPGFMDSRIKRLYDAGFGAELETAAEIAKETAKKSPYNMFAAMVSAKAGNWETKTLEIVRATWEVRRNAMMVLDKLELNQDSLKPVLAIAWRLKSTIVRYLGIATERATGVKNPIGLFFWLTKKQRIGNSSSALAT